MTNEQIEKLYELRHNKRVLEDNLKSINDSIEQAIIESEKDCYEYGKKGYVYIMSSGSKCIWVTVSYNDYRHFLELLKQTNWNKIQEINKQIEQL